ncbi:MAG: methyltransferase domain-containing protein [bacterium]|nr:methyltransferase domain-containing protein [bacterium]
MKTEGENGKSLPKRKNVLFKRKVLGPIDNLEENVTPDWWQKIFNFLYLKTDGDVVNDQTITTGEIDRFLDICNVAKDDHILDLCCGQGRHSLELARRGFKNVEGLDRSHYLIQKAKTQNQKEGLDIKFKEGDARKIPYSTDDMDLVMILGNSFGYFDTVDDDMKILKEVFRILKPWGKLLIDLTDGEYLKKNFEPRSWEWIGKRHFVCRERSLSVDEQRLITREVITHVEKGVIADQFYAERLYTREKIINLLKAAGFTDINFPGRLETASQRNQDLGMMAKRLIITAVVRKDWAPVRKKTREEVKNVVVLLGDPRRPDLLKPNAVFDDDDLYTIDELKNALRELKDFKFSYFNNHTTLIHDLMKNKNKIDLVFNLCDEGFNNDPRKELHVPSLLEKLEIPYTGSGPQTLAYCYDKSLIRGIAQEMAIPVAKAFFIKPEDSTFELPIEFPVIVKPNFGDSSFGITQRSVTFNLDELINAISEIREKFGYDKPILVEEFLSGNDMSVGIIGNPPEQYVVLPVIEEDYSELPEDLPKICGYEAKWDPDSPYWKLKSVPANIPDETKKLLEDWCLKLVERLDCRDYTRLDWRLDSQGNPRLLEVNPNPGWCWDGHLNKMSKLAGMSYTEMLKAILAAASERLKIGR